MYNKTPTPRQVAISQGKSRYVSTPCIHGHTGERFVRNNACVQCHKLINKKAKKAYRQRKKEQTLAVKAQRLPKTVFELWIKRSKSGKNKKVRQSLSVDYYKTLYATHCPLLGLELTYGPYIGAIPKNYASLDKIDPQKGYIEGNVQIISFRANTLKNSATLEEMQMIVNNWEKQKIY